MNTDTTIGADTLQAGPRRRHAAPCLFHCIAGGFGMGYQSQNPIMGGFAGALGGLGAGASIASGMGAGAMVAGMAASVAIPVIGLAIGAVAGEVGPIPLNDDADGKEAEAA